MLWKRRTEGSGRWVLLLLKCIYSTELAALGCCCSYSPWGKEIIAFMKVEWSPSSPFNSPPSGFFSVNSLRLFISLVLHLVGGWSFFCTASTPGFNRALYYLGLLAFLNRKVCQRADKIEEKCYSSVILSLFFLIVCLSGKWGPGETQEREKDVWVCLSSTATQFKATFNQLDTLTPVLNKPLKK